MNRTFKVLILFLVLLASCNAYAKNHLAGVLDLLLDTEQVEVFHDNFDNPNYWTRFVSEDKLNISTDGFSGGQTLDAQRTIDAPIPVDNISWKIKYDDMYFDEGKSSLNLNYGGINIFVLVSESTMPFPVYNGAQNVILIVEYKDGTLTAKANGKNLKSPFLGALTATISSDISSSVNVESSTSGGADNTGISSITLSLITATSVLKD